MHPIPSDRNRKRLREGIARRAVRKWQRSWEPIRFISAFPPIAEELNTNNFARAPLEKGFPTASKEPFQRFGGWTRRSGRASLAATPAPNRVGMVPRVASGTNNRSRQSNQETSESAKAQEISRIGGHDAGSVRRWGLLSEELNPAATHCSLRDLPPATALSRLWPALRIGSFAGGCRHRLVRVLEGARRPRPARGSVSSARRTRFFDEDSSFRRPFFEGFEDGYSEDSFSENSFSENRALMGSPAPISGKVGEYGDA